MKLIGVFFEVNDRNIYTHLTNVFKYSVHKHMPHVDLEIHELPAPVIENKKHQHQMIKQRKWTELALQQTDDYCIIDTDMLIVGDLSTAFKNDFDIAYTAREWERKPLNGGMIFGRPNDRSKNFWVQWLDCCEKAYNDKEYWSVLNRECKGFAQSALWHIICNDINCNIFPLPCSIYNACDEEWAYVNNDVKAYHIKGKMRKALFHNQEIPCKKVYDIWRKYEVEYHSSH